MMRYSHWNLSGRVKWEFENHKAPVGNFCELLIYFHLLLHCLQKESPVSSTHVLWLFVTPTPVYTISQGMLFYNGAQTRSKGFECHIHTMLCTLKLLLSSSVVVKIIDF